MLGGWVNPHREQQTIPQGQTSSPPTCTPTVKARPDQASLATSAETRGVTHDHGLGVLLALTALAQHIAHSPSSIDEKRPTQKCVYCIDFTLDLAWRCPPFCMTSLTSSL